MPSGRKPDLERRRQMLTLRDRGLTFHEIALRFGVSKQAIWSLLYGPSRSRRAARTVPCSACGATILSPGALPRDGATALCLSCLRSRSDVPFSQRLKALRLAAGLNRTELATRAGVAPGSLRAYEDGTRAPHERTVHRLAAVLGSDLLDDSGKTSTALCDAS